MPPEPTGGLLFYSAIVVSTLAIAGIFSPARKRVQDFIDRRFYRRRYDAERTLEAFAATLRDEVDIDRLSAHLVSTAWETLQPQSAWLWLKGKNGGTSLIALPVSKVGDSPIRKAGKS